MKHALKTAGFAVAILGVPLAPALAHHVMDGRLPGTLVEGLLSGLGHPIIGVDHLVAVIAVGCLAALHRRGAQLAVGYVLAMIVGAAVHLRGATVPGAELMVALSLLGLGAILIWRQPVGAGVVAGLFAIAGLFHGYALGESIVGVEPTPLVSYFVGLAAIQALIALVAFKFARLVVAPGANAPWTLRAAGAVVAAVGAIGLAGQFAA